MTGAPIYYVEPQHEPWGNGWYRAPSDQVATVFCVIRRQDDYESVIATAPTRRGAESVIAHLTAARRLEDAAPPPPPAKPKPQPFRSLMLGIPVLVAFFILCGAINAAT